MHVPQLCSSCVSCDVRRLNSLVEGDGASNNSGEVTGECTLVFTCCWSWSTYASSVIERARSRTTALALTRAATPRQPCLIFSISHPVWVATPAPFTTSSVPPIA